MRIYRAWYANGVDAINSQLSGLENMKPSTASIIIILRTFCSNQIYFDEGKGREGKKRKGS